VNQKQVQKLSDEELAAAINESHDENKAAVDAVQGFQRNNQTGAITAAGMQTYRALAANLEVSKVKVNFFAAEMHRRQNEFIAAALNESPFKSTDNQ
jgi:flavin-binding protein dodecin